MQRHLRTSSPRLTTLLLIITTLAAGCATTQKRADNDRPRPAEPHTANADTAAKSPTVSQSKPASTPPAPTAVEPAAPNDTADTAATTPQPQPEPDLAAPAEPPVVDDTPPTPDIDKLATYADDDAYVQLKDFRGGWTVLHFFTQTDVPKCACQATAYTTLLEKLHTVNADHVYAVTDLDTVKLRLARHRFMFKVGLLSDASHLIAEPFGATFDATVDGETTTHLKHVTVVLNPAGKVAKWWPRIDDPEAHLSEIKSTLAAVRVATNQP